MHAREVIWPEDLHSDILFCIETGASPLKVMKVANIIPFIQEMFTGNCVFLL